MPPGKFIVVEGLEGAGKTTAIRTVSTQLKLHGIYDQVITREPGGTKLAEAIRRLIKEGVEDEFLNKKAELLMFYAARIQLVENKIKPALIRGDWVIGDRHDLSTQAYQGAGKQLDQQLITMLKQKVLGNFKPDLTLYLDLPPEIGLKRAKWRGQLDHFEQQPLHLFRKIRQRYLEFAKEDESIVTIDAAKSLDDVTSQINVVLSAWLKESIR